MENIYIEIAWRILFIITVGLVIYFTGSAELKKEAEKEIIANQIKGITAPEYYVINKYDIPNIMYNYLLMILIAILLLFTTYFYACIFLIFFTINNIYLDNRTTHKNVTHLQEPTKIFITMFLFSPFFIIFQHILKDMRKYNHIESTLRYYELEATSEYNSKSTQIVYEQRINSCHRQLKLRKLRKKNLFISLFKK